MPLTIDDRTAEALARELALQTGESVTTAVTIAVRERLERLRGPVARERRREEIMRIARRSSERRIDDHRSADEIVGCDADDVPT